MKRILVLAHREELIFQAVGHARNAGLTAGIEMGSRRAMREDVVVSTIQTQNAQGKCKACVGAGCAACNESGRMRRFQKFDPHEFGLVIVDEGHHAPAKSYRTVLEYYRQNPNLKILMVTATPKRHDRLGLHNVCDSAAYEMHLRDAIDQGWLVPIRQRFITVDWLDLSKVGTKAGGDLADGEVEKAFISEIDEDDLRRLHEIAKPCLDEAKGEPILVFASGVVHAEKLAAAFNAYDGVTAEVVLGTTDKLERPQIIERYKRGDTQVLVGCGCFTEGFDAPGTRVIAGARPTKSESLYLQMIGRGTRPAPGVVDGPETPQERQAAIAASGKPDCIVLDFVGNSGKHKLISVFDVLAGSDVEPIDLEAALAIAKETPESVDVDELIEKAKQAREEREKRLAEQKERERIATERRADQAGYTAQDVDIFSGGSFDPFTDYEPAPWQATQKQVNLLIGLGVSPKMASEYSKQQAGAVITSLKSKEGGEYRIYWGKHRGKKLSQIPRGYVDWMIQNNVRMDELRQHINLMRNPPEPSPVNGEPF